MQLPWVSTIVGALLCRFVALQEVASHFFLFLGSLIVALQALGACEGIWALEAHDAKISATKFARLSTKYWLAFLQYWWFSLQIRFKVLAFASIFPRKDDSAVPSAAAG
jgi:hypothetical protein